MAADQNVFPEFFLYVFAMVLGFVLFAAAINCREEADEPP
jgi:hypothetical protein